MSLILALVIVSCGGERSHETLVDRIALEESVYTGSTSSEGLLLNEDLFEITEDEHVFLIPERKSKIKSFACTECHSVPLNQMKGAQGRKAHWDIEIDHANEETMNCATCHVIEDMNSLRTLTGQKIDFDHSYKLCAQCHSNQFEDWKGGAHGKKVAGWAPPRASMTCVNCHNPHSPGFESRWPAQFNTRTATERKEGLGH